MTLRTFVTAAPFACALMLANALPATAGDWIFGAGYSSFSREGAEDSALVSVEYQHDAFWQRGNFDASFGAALDVQTTGDLFIGAGAVGKWHLQRGWFIETSVMPGAYAESVRLNDLGSTFEIRSAIAVGKEFANGKSLSLALTHKSNASTADINPGVNSLLLRWHVPFNG
ncbi:Lipid A 3-O-deacylase (PagL) [Phaeobacter piscinae]|uniref:Lipid A 3-O-deacylase (PagL) n=1 Tax=Phaeobacter piscinae TaxID=1580596 RepID=A0AAN1L9H3_9RHOB|nr:acyloxyacyl hydrolase [Phaeobacter piscinae]ATG42374.1 Lipid A 3-O-deacylase (PagL) [Phaeobacter piscinae]AUR34708.1 Lipid A 3-O-deacylase (PagL) [Phaeobacter piscinae]